MKVSDKLTICVWICFSRGGRQVRDIVSFAELDALCVLHVCVRYCCCRGSWKSLWEAVEFGSQFFRLFFPGFGFGNVPLRRLESASGWRGCTMIEVSRSSPWFDIALKIGVVILLM